MNKNIETVKAAYAAFRHGDVLKVKDLLSLDVNWIIAGPADTVPYAGCHHGRKAVGDYFAALGKVEDVRKFDAREFFADGDTVIVKGHYQGHVKSTRHEYHYDWVHIFTLTAGMISKFQQYCDTAAIVEAYTVK